MENGWPLPPLRLLPVHPVSRNQDNHRRPLAPCPPLDSLPSGRHLRSMRSHSSLKHTPPTNLSHGLSNPQVTHTQTLYSDQVQCTTFKHFATCPLMCAFILLCIRAVLLFTFLFHAHRTCTMTINVYSILRCADTHME